jgi:hypothetical protein
LTKHGTNVIIRAAFDAVARKTTATAKRTDKKSDFSSLTRQENQTMTTKEIQQQIISNVREWQKIENASVASTGKIIDATANPIVRLVMEIIGRDSQMHYRVQELIADSLETKTISLTPEELGEVWTMIEKHIELEKKTIEHAKTALAALKGKKMLVQEYLLNYLLIDEEKHNKVLEMLGIIQKGLYPYA